MCIYIYIYLLPVYNEDSIFVTFRSILCNNNNDNDNNNDNNHNHNNENNFVLVFGFTYLILLLLKKCKYNLLPY